MTTAEETLAQMRLDRVAELDREIEAIHTLLVDNGKRMVAVPDDPIEEFDARLSMLEKDGIAMEDRKVELIRRRDAILAAQG